MSEHQWHKARQAQAFLAALPLHPDSRPRWVDSLAVAGQAGWELGVACFYEAKLRPHSVRRTTQRKSESRSLPLKWLRKQVNPIKLITVTLPPSGADDCRQRMIRFDGLGARLFRSQVICPVPGKLSCPGAFYS